MNLAKLIPNTITFLRIPLTLILVCYILQGEYVNATLLFIMICLTDISDGATARALGACTRLGAYMDVAADLLYVVASLVILNMNGLAPIWFSAVVVIKFIEFAVTSHILKRSDGKANVWVFDKLGRYFAALAFISPGIFCAAALLPEVLAYVEYLLFAPACVLAAASSAARGVRCFQFIKSRKLTYS